ncbi:DEAD/DEAH box helicase [Scytonema hofmannii PCC 7110]|uniref:DEAD/DEAH box helicase n=1 Tax=Scytonema hofmannii PCC 7110 TaxID=128403 RepID=A0A139XAI2_9CYAN|nr:DEAD/DEAH box helicase [Scytonema hofmannii]KYC41676.1 DEAD/DEAH box helicase [Scytonema hofmannii PCC 7110]
MTSKYLDPIAAVEQPRQDFIRYLLTAYPLRDRHLRYALKQQLEQPGTVWQHPYLEGSQPYKPASSVNSLVNQKILHPEMVPLFVPSQRPLYEHQEKAVTAVIQDKQNIVVATGTGSGKTECFLLPMLDMLLKEETEVLISGVRALILYPMNALVNDQVKRLRKLLCRQTTIKIRFGFYTSRTETKKEKALEALEQEFAAYEYKELEELFTETEIKNLKLHSREKLIDKAIEKTLKVQCLSREEIWEKPPHILVTNYSMLEHMLIRPKERNEIFGVSTSTFKMLVVDEAHTYNGSTGSEVSMLLERLKVAIGIEKPGQIRCIATSASLGDALVDKQVLQFAEDFFHEPFSQVIRGSRVTATERLGSPYVLPSEFSHQEVFNFLRILELPNLDDNIEQWSDVLGNITPQGQLASAQSQAQGNIHKFLWFALKQHPLLHRLIDLLSRQPQQWEHVARSQELWCINLPFTLDGQVDDTDAKVALSNLLQLGTLARENPEDLPLLPVRLHLLFRSLEGVYACINPDCSGVECDPDYPQSPRYGRLYLNEKITCDYCTAPVLELGSCAQCGQAYTFTQLNNSSKLESLPRSNQGLREKENHKNIYTLTSGVLDSVIEDEEIGEIEEEISSSAPQTFTIRQRNGWIGIPSNETFSQKSQGQGEFHLAWYRHSQNNAKDLEGCYLPKCAACGTRPIRAQAINRFVAYTDEPLEAMIDSLFKILPESEAIQGGATKRKLLTFSDGRQDAAFFASDYQRNHTEILYRQMIWRAFEEVKDNDNITSMSQVINQLKLLFLETSIPHPDRDSRRNYLSYFPEDEESLDNKKDCQDASEARAKELLLREFALPFNRRYTLEAFTVLACHLESLDERLIELVSTQFEISKDEAQIFLTVLTDIIRRTGIVSIDGASRYFPETGGVENVRPEMVDVQGKSKNYLFLEKSPEERKKFQDSPSFLPKWRKDGKVSAAQNRLGWYYFQLFGERFPSREKLTWLFQQLKDSRLLVSAKNGYQLNWMKLNLQNTEEDWYQCSSCQHIAHVPGLSKVDKPTINVFGCPSYKCQGKLQPYSCEKMTRVTNEHYQQHLIKHRAPLPLRSQEHTAQLGVGELEKRENRFRRGQINMLSCSTTLEMGVDIGELQAVVLRNFPPHVSNYQQRAGRAGRRTDGVAITLMYGQRRPHDRFYFEQPEKLIAGSNQIPKLDVGNLQIQQRHLRSELLAEFLRIHNVGAEEVKIGDFFSLPQNYSAENFSSPATSLFCEFQEWLDSDRARSIAKSWIKRLKSVGTAQNVIDLFLEALSNFEREQLGDWNGLTSLLQNILQDISAESDRKKRKVLEKRRDSVEDELDKIAKRRLHDELVQASILPIYGFPIDVVRLLTGESNEYKSSQGKHRLERDRRLALGEYAPGQEIIVDDRVYQSVAIVRPGDLEQEYYWICHNCNHFLRSNQPVAIDECPVCNVEPSTAAKKMKAYKVPKAFCTEWTATPKVTPYTKPQRQPTSQVFLAGEGEKAEEFSHSGFYFLTTSQGGRFFLANQGLAPGKGFNKQGFAICKTCGYNLSERVQIANQTNNSKPKGKKPSTPSPSQLLIHNHPITGRECKGGYELLHLGHEFRSDLLKIRFDRDTKPNLLFGKVVNYRDSNTVSSVTNTANQATNGLDFWRSLTYALLAAAAQAIDIPRQELDGLFRPLTDGLAEIIIYDNVPGGAGYSKRIADNFQQVLELAYQIVTTCSCDTSCYDCLRTYSNQPFHAELKRNLIADFLRPLVEKLAPDPELQNFAPHASRVQLAQMADRLPAVSRRASEVSTIYLPSLLDRYNLNNNSPLSWFALLEDIVYSMQRSKIPLELIVNQLLEARGVASESEKTYLQVFYKRLGQWIDQGLLKLYKTPVSALPILCLNTEQQNRIALQLHQNSEIGIWEWFQTRSYEGVSTVFQRLQGLRSQAKLVTAKELEDPQTSVAFPDRNWGDLTLPQLRHKLGLDKVLLGSLSQIVYRDRYLNEKGAKILAHLLQSDGLNKNSSVTIEVLEDSQGETQKQRKHQLELALSKLKERGVSLNIIVRPWQHRVHFPHARELEVYQKDGQKFQVLFDKGIDFLEPRARDFYCVTERSYVVVTELEV